MEVDPEVLAQRRAEMETREKPWSPNRVREVSKALRAYAKMATSYVLKDFSNHTGEGKMGIHPRKATRKSDHLIFE